MRGFLSWLSNDGDEPDDDSPKPERGKFIGSRQHHEKPQY